VILAERDGAWIELCGVENSIISGEESVAPSPCFCTGAPGRS
jgi:hypothetical protein